MQPCATCATCTGRAKQCCAAMRQSAAHATKPDSLHTHPFQDSLAWRCGNIRRDTVPGYEIEYFDTSPYLDYRYHFCISQVGATIESPAAHWQQHVHSGPLMQAARVSTHLRHAYRQTACYTAFAAAAKIKISGQQPHRLSSRKPPMWSTRISGDRCNSHCTVVTKSLTKGCNFYVCS